MPCQSKSHFSGTSIMDWTLQLWNTDGPTGQMPEQPFMMDDGVTIYIKVWPDTYRSIVPVTAVDGNRLSSLCLRQWLEKSWKVKDRNVFCTSLRMMICAQRYIQYCIFWKSPGRDEHSRVQCKSGYHRNVVCISTMQYNGRVSAAWMSRLRLYKRQTYIIIQWKGWFTQLTNWPRFIDELAM